MVEGLGPPQKKSCFLHKVVTLGASGTRTRDVVQSRNEAYKNRSKIVQKLMVRQVEQSPP